MEKYLWWTDRQKQLADELEEFADEVAPRALEAVWKYETPWDIVRKTVEKGWYGALIPEEYGGMNLGCTGACIVAEGLSRTGTAAGIYITTMFGGTHQIVGFGTKEQKERWLPNIVKGEIFGALALTEPLVGSDAASVETTARREDDEYIISGKKRFISNGGIANSYFVYARTSDKPEDRKKYRHLTAFVVEKGTPGFTVEKMNELIGFDSARNAYLDFDEVRVPADNVIGGEGNGWQVMISGLNFERTIVAAGFVGGIREALRYAFYVTRRRIQFGQPVIEFESNQYRMADMIIGLKAARLLTYYTAYLFDQGKEPVTEASAAKILVTESVTKSSFDAIHCMGGDGMTKFYPVEAIARSAKINEIGAGTNDVLRRLLVRFAPRFMPEDLKEPRRRIHKELGIPIPIFVGAKSPNLEGQVEEDKILEVLAEDYKVNPGLYMTREDLEEDVGLKSEQLDKLLLALEEKGLVKLYRDRRDRISLIKASYLGLKRAKPREYYRWFPSWIKKDDIF